MKESGNVTLIGEATGGDTGNGPRPFCTKQRTYFRIPTRQPDVSSKGFPMEGIGILPHHQVSQTVADFMKDEDTVLNYGCRTDNRETIIHFLNEKEPSIKGVSPHDTWLFCI